VDAWRAPKRIFDAHPPDQCAQLRFDLRPPSQWERLPTPVAAKAGPVPTHECLGPDDCENLQDRRKPAIQLNQEPAIMVREPDATRQPTPHDNQLMSKHRVLSLKPQLQLEWRGQDGQKETEQPDHSASLGDSITPSTRIRFSVHTTFSRFFQKNSGRSFTDYLAELRIGRACRLLAETQQPVSGICYEVGYFNLSNFNRNFLKRRGMTPSRYRDLALRKCPPRHGPYPKEAT